MIIFGKLGRKLCLCVWLKPNISILKNIKASKGSIVLTPFYKNFTWEWKFLILTSNFEKDVSAGLER